VSGLRLGVDAGGTGTRAVLVRDGEVVSRLSEGPLNVLLHADALDRLSRLITQSGATEAGLGLAGVRSDAEAARIAAELTRRTGSRVAVGDDAEAALLGAFDGGPGIVVIAGTGSAALGRASDGRTVRVGGHGYLLGDEGGGYWIGNTALRHALRSADLTGPRLPALELLLCRHFQVSSVHDIEPLVYAEPTDRALLAGLVPALAESSDEQVLTLFTDAAQVLSDLVQAVTTDLGPLPVAMVGGVWNVAWVRSRFVELTGAIDPMHPSEWGALLLLDQRDTA
jgi:glucosamine kinase